MLSTTQYEAWERDGFLVLPGFYGEAELNTVEEALRGAWASNDERVVVDDLVTNRRCMLSALSDEERTHRFKTNDLYLTDARVRQIALGARMAPILERLLGHVPVLCNSLNFDQGSAQDAHIDSLYMTPLTRGHLCAIWVALEDVAPEAGPLFYYPGSHKIAPYKFSDGTYHQIDTEAGSWRQHVAAQIQLLGLERQVFHAKRGDVFVWSADLLHGGSPLQDPARTRKSVVFHYYSAEDCRQRGSLLEPINGAYWMRRERQSVPEDAPALAARERQAKQLSGLHARIGKLEEQLARARRDPFDVRKRAARARRRIERVLSDASRSLFSRNA